MAKQIAWLLIMGMSVVACDKGRKSLNNGKAEFKDVLEGPLTLDNVDRGQKAWMFLEVLSMAHSKEGSGEEAHKLAVELREKAVRLVTEVTPKVQTEMAAAKLELKPLEAQTDSMKKDAERAEAKRGEFKFREGDCIAMNYGKEFESKSSLFDVRLYRVEKVGKDAAMIKTLHRLKENDQITRERLASLAAEPAREEMKAFYRSAAKIDCKRADIFIHEMTAVADKIAPAYRIMEKFVLAMRLSGAEPTTF